MKTLYSNMMNWNGIVFLGLWKSGNLELHDFWKSGIDRFHSLRIHIHSSIQRIPFILFPVENNILQFNSVFLLIYPLFHHLNRATLNQVYPFQAAIQRPSKVESWIVESKQCNQRARSVDSHSWVHSVDSTSIVSSDPFNAPQCWFWVVEFKEYDQHSPFADTAPWLQTVDSTWTTSKERVNKPEGFLDFNF